MLFLEYGKDVSKNKMLSTGKDWLSEYIEKFITPRKNKQDVSETLSKLS